MLTERQRLILNAIIDDYIRSAEPVGSRTISKKGDVGFSPATIRNEMSDLEELGFLEQPHTSAGRIPSMKGYRYYVDHLVRKNKLTTHEMDTIKRFFAERLQEVEEVMQQAATILSSLTNYTSIVLGPEMFHTTLRHFQLIPLSEHSAVAIVVTNTGHVENKTISLPEGMSMAEIEKVVHILNAKLTGIPLYQLKAKLYSEIGNELSSYVNKYEEIVHMVENVLKDDDKDRLFVSGSTNILTMPEFKDVEKVKTILDLFDESQSLVKSLSDLPAGLQVKIGSENTLQAMNNCSLVTASFVMDGQSLGTLGILGPMRMEYGKVISLLEHLSEDLLVYFSKWYK